MCKIYEYKDILERLEERVERGYKLKPYKYSKQMQKLLAWYFAEMDIDI